MADPRQKLWTLVDDNPTCMMVTVDGANELDARPMNVCVRPDDDTLLFYTRMRHGKSADIAETGKVCLCFSAPKDGEYVTVVGHAALETDRSVIREHWSPFVAAWFPEGPEGADVGMIRVKATRARFWDGESSDVLAAIKMLRASATGDTPDLGEEAKLRFG